MPNRLQSMSAQLQVSNTFGNLAAVCGGQRRKEGSEISRSGLGASESPSWCPPSLPVVLEPPGMGMGMLRRVGQRNCPPGEPLSARIRPGLGIPRGLCGQGCPAAPALGQWVQRGRCWPGPHGVPWDGELQLLSCWAGNPLPAAGSAGEFHQERFL